MSKDETRQTLARLNLNIYTRSVCDNICGSNTFVFIAFALALGVPRENMGYVSSILGFACILQVASLLLSRRSRDKRRFVLILAYLEPLVLLVSVICVPFISPDWRLPLIPVAWQDAVLSGAGWRLPVLAVSLFAAAGLLHLTLPLTQEWSASTVPEGLRGRYLGRRLQALTAVNIATVLVVGWVANHIDRQNAFGFSHLLAIGSIFGLVAVLPLRRVSLPTLSAESTVHAGELVKVFAHRPFRRYLLALVLFEVSFALAIPYYQVVHLEIIGMTPALIACQQTSYYLCKILASPFIGRWVDRFGPRAIFLITSPIYAIFFASFSLVSHGVAWPIFVGWFLAGLGDGCFFVGNTAALYATIPNDRTRSAYFAVMNLANTGTMAVGALLAVAVVKSMAGVDLRLGSWHIGQYQAHYLVCGAIMLLCGFGGLLLPRRRRAPIQPGESS